MSFTNLGLALEFPAFAEINVVPLNTLHRFHTGMVRMVSFVTQHFWQWLNPTDSGDSPRGNSVLWRTIATTRFRWEAELMQQVFIAHEITTRIIDLGIEPYMGQGSAAALQVPAEDEQSARLLLLTLEGDAEALK